MKESDDNLEKFFNSRMGDGDFPFEEKDWVAMKKQLDDFDRMTVPAPYFHFRRLLPYLPVALLLFLAGWFARDLFTSDNDNKYTQVEMPRINQTPDHESIGNAENGDIQDDVILQLRENDTSAADYKLERRIPSASNESSEPSVSLAQQEKHDTGITGNNTDEADLTELPEQPEVTLPLNTENNTSPRASVVSKAEFQAGLLALGKDFVEFPVAEVIPGIYPVSIRKKDETRIRYSRWSVGLVLAPDLNGVSGLGNYRAAWEIGIQGYFELAQRWRLSTGVLYAGKKYKAAGEDYNPPEGYWKYVSNGEIPEEVEAVCDILDVPLNVTFIWTPESRVRFTSTFGFSSYFILSENYEYDFSYYSPDHPDGWHTGNNSSAFFAMLNFGIGAEWQAAPGFYLGAEPYYKLPLSEIGYGNVRLSGTGIQVSIRKSIP